MSAVVVAEVPGGVAGSRAAVVVGWDNVTEDIGAAEQALEALRGLRGPGGALRERIMEAWPELRPR